MKILLIAPQPFLEKRGTPLAVYQLVEALSQLGYHIDLVTYHLGDDVSIKNLRHHRIWKVPFIKSVRKGQSAGKLILDFFIFFKAFILLCKNRYDCIHAVEEAAMMSMLLKLLFRLPLIYDMDSSIPEQLEESNSMIWGNRAVVSLTSIAEKWTVRYSDLVIAVCRALKERVVRIAPDKDVALLQDIPNVHDELVSEDEIRRLRENLGIGKGKVVLYTGTFEPYQGIDLLLEAWELVVREMPDARLILVGGEPEQVESKNAKAKAMGIDGSTIIMGKRPMEEMPAFMNMSDILASPRNKGTNTPMKIYTYLQSGRPVVATKLLTHTQVLTEDVSLLVEPQAEAFASGIIRLLKDVALRRSLGSAGKLLVEREYSFKCFKDKVEDAYRRIASC